MRKGKSGATFKKLHHSGVAPPVNRIEYSVTFGFVDRVDWVDRVDRVDKSALAVSGQFFHHLNA